MEVRLSWEGEQRLVLMCQGEMGWDSTETLLNQAKHALGASIEPQVIVDLQRVDYVTSAGIGELLQLRKLVSEHGGVMVMTRLSPLLLRLFRTVGLDRHVPMLDTLDEARELLTKRASASAPANPGSPASPAVTPGVAS
jgi:anti-anti-sigma factor